MAGPGQGGPNMDQFEAFFQRADLDRDGRISGAEAVGFFQGSNLPKQVLAQIWQYSDPRRTGFLGRAEFYNALKLVTVAQSKRELTPDIVKAALYGPASAKIPAPQINLAAIQAPQSSSAPAPVAQMGRGVAPQTMNLAAATPQMGQNAPSASQNVGFRGQGPPNANPGFGGQGPPNANLGFGGQAPPAANLGFGGQAHSTSTMNQNYYSSQGNPSMRPSVPQSTGSALRPQLGVASSAPAASNWAGGQIGGASSHSSNQAVNTPTSSAGSKSLESFLSTPVPASTGSNASVGSGPGNGFTPNPVYGGNNFPATPSLQSASSATLSSAIVPVSSGPPTSSTPDLFSSLQSGFTRQPVGTQQFVQPPSTANQHVSAQNTPLLTSSGPSVGQVNSTSNQPQLPWPKMTPAGIQKYTKVFMEVDSDRDGKITGEQARSLFMSWRLPREVLKQVWDLSDQDNDSMLSLREFCVALYLMERFREGRPLPPTLPSNILLDETLLSLTGQSSASYGNAAWGHTAGFRPQQGMPGVRPMGPATGLRPPVPGRFPQGDGAAHADQQKDRTSSVANSHANQFSNGEQISLDTNSQGSTETEKKVDEKIILDSKEKLEFYRTKMQDLVLYKSRCDNRLNEITERALADKREAELLRKKYEEKYKQVAETASKLTIEEAAFREIQERKIELQQAITKMEQGGSADGILQVRADRIQSELEELMRALTERCKKHGIDIKSAAVIELPTGWQPGIPEISSVWDEDWDKFDDEGVSFGMAAPHQAQPASPKDHFAPDLMSHDDEEMSETSFSRDDRPFEVESAYGHSEDESGKSPSGSPAGRSAFESPSQEYSSDHFRKSPEADTDSQRNFDEPGWGTFDNNDDDIDSVWGFNNSKGSDHDKYGEKSFFDSSEFGDSPRRSDSPHADTFHKKSLFFEDSVPSTPLSRASSSPPRYSFDNMSRFDSFSTRDDTFTAKTFSRFDSMSSTAGFERGQGGHARFDSISSSSGFDPKQGFSSFDDNDPFGSSGPFKVSSDGQTPKKGGSEPWSSF